MVKDKFVVGPSKWLHLRPATVLCKEALEFQSSIKLITGNTTADVKSVLGVLAAGIKTGMEFELVCEGMDEEAALERLRIVIAEQLGTNEKNEKAGGQHDEI